MSAETVREKAERLLSEDRVTTLYRGGVGVFAVKGDTRSYLVCVLPAGHLRSEARRRGVEPSSCTCEARGSCSHLLAADAVFRAGQT